MSASEPFDEYVATCRRCGLSRRAAIVGVLCAPPHASGHDFAAGNDPNLAAFERNTHNEHILWEEIKNVTERAIDAAYGTDPRHGLLARAVADEVAFGRPVPWGIASHFGMSTLPGKDTGRR